MSYRIAVLSDIHANGAAFDAVIADAKRQGVAGYWVLGDHIGRGCEPIQTLVKVWDLFHQQNEIDQRYWLFGNHDYNVLNADKTVGVLRDSMGNERGTSTGDQFQTIEMAAWHQDMLNQSHALLPRCNAWLQSLPSYYLPQPEDRGRYAGIACAHAALRYTNGVLNETETYRTYLYYSEDLQQGSFPLIQSQFDELAQHAPRPPRLILAGHTHMAGIWRSVPDGQSAERIDDSATLDLEAHVYYINVGSVGFPRSESCPTYYTLTWGDNETLSAQKHTVPYQPNLQACPDNYPDDLRAALERCAADEGI